jgi:hypothetical protein
MLEGRVDVTARDLVVLPQVSTNLSVCECVCWCVCMCVCVLRVCVCVCVCVGVLVHRRFASSLTPCAALCNHVCASTTCPSLSLLPLFLPPPQYLRVLTEQLEALTARRERLTRPHGDYRADIDLWRDVLDEQALVRVLCSLAVLSSALLSQHTACYKLTAIHT